MFKKGNENIAKRPEVREKISKAKKGKKPSELTKKKMSTAHRGQIAWNKGLTKEIDDRVKKMAEKISNAWKDLVKTGYKSPNRKPYVKLICKQCKKEFEVHYASRNRRKCCSKVCLKEFMKGKTWEERWGKEVSDKNKKALHERLIINNPFTWTDVRKKVSNSQKGLNNSSIRGGSKRFDAKGGFREDLGHYVRSSWEANYARILILLKINYQYEPKTFDLGKNTYTPDFYLPETEEYYEIKGYFPERDKQKLSLFKQLYPDIKLSLINKQEYLSLKEKYENLIPSWENY